MKVCLECGSTEITKQVDRDASFWRCSGCGFERAAKPEWQIRNAQKRPSDKVIQSISCHCCNDTGHLGLFDVQDFIEAGYCSWDAPVLCMRDSCRAGTTKRGEARMYETIPSKEGKLVANHNVTVGYRGLALATESQCDEIHRINIQKNFDTSAPAQAKVLGAIESLVYDKEF